VSDEQPNQATPPGVATARAKYHCPACGADAHWNPAKQKLVCPFCGTESPAPLEMRTETTAITEHDLNEALQQAPDAAVGWQTKKITVRCQSCQALSVFDPDKIAQRCEFCGSAQLVPYEEAKEAFRPESLLALKISESQARDLIRAWYQKQWLAPNALNKKALTDTVRAVYLPYWTFDANAFAQWTADSGTYYYTGTGKARQRHVNWTPVAGELSHVFDDHLVPASLGVDPGRLRAIEPFPTVEGLIPYDPGYLAGWTVERYQIDLVAAAKRALQEMFSELREMCARQIPGDTYRNLQVHPTFSNQRFKHILVPVWLMSYRYGTTTYQVVVNGVTGKMSGGRPWSWIKITLLVLTALIILILVNALDS
jgi:hypothetical protein